MNARETCIAFYPGGDFDTLAAGLHARYGNEETPWERLPDQYRDRWRQDAVGVHAYRGDYKRRLALYIGRGRGHSRGGESVNRRPTQFDNHKAWSREWHAGEALQDEIKRLLVVGLQQEGFSNPYHAEVEASNLIQTLYYRMHAASELAPHDAQSQTDASR